jgi:hypothetical protein
LGDRRRKKEASKILTEARAFKEEWTSKDSLGVDMKEADEAAIFDQMVSCRTGRFGSRQNLAWQHKGRASQHLSNE